MTQRVEEVASRVPLDGLMWAMVLGHPHGHLMRIHVPMPHVGADDLLIRVTACGICELDRELEQRGHRFVRYADDCNI